MSSYIDEHFENTWGCLEDTLGDLKRIFDELKQQRMDDAKIKRLYRIVTEAQHFQATRKDIERVLQSGKAPTDEQIKGVRVFEERLFRELERLERIGDEERARERQGGTRVRDIAYRAQTPEQKQEIIERLHALWLRNPELRLGQLILNCFRDNFYYTEDFKLIDVLEQRYAEQDKE